MQLDPIEGEYKTPKSIHKHTTSQNVVCPNCSNTVVAKDINIEDKITKCSECSQIFSFQSLINTLVQAPASKKKPILGNQKDVDVFEYAGELSISVWDMYDWWALICFCIAGVPK